MPPILLWPSLAAAAALLLVTVALARSAMRSRTTPAGAPRGRPGRSGGPRDRMAVDRIEQDLRALDWLWQQGRIGGHEYRRERERILRD
jgi:hypothetical protein